MILYGVVSLLAIRTPVYEELVSLGKGLLWIGLGWSLIQIGGAVRSFLLRGTVIIAAVVAFVTLLATKGFYITPYAHWNKFLFPIGNAIYYGDFMALHLPLGMYLLFVEDQKLRRVFWTISLVLIFMGLWLSECRASFVGLSVSLPFGGFLLVKSRFLNRKSFAILMLSFVLLGVFSDRFVSGRPGEIPTWNRLKGLAVMPLRSDLNEVSGGRVHTYLNTLEMIRDRPFLGWGPGSFRFVYPEYAHRIGYDPHIRMEQWLEHPLNELLNQAVEGGFCGVSLFVIWWIILFGLAWRSLRLSQDRDESLLLITALVGLVFLSISWQFSLSSIFPLTRFLVAFYLSMLWPLLRINTVRVLTSPVWLQPVLLILISFLTLFTLSYQFSLYASVKGQSAKTIDAQKGWLKCAVSLAPWGFEPLLRSSSRYLWTTEREKAWPFVEGLYRQFPSMPIVLYQRAAMYYQQGDDRRALELMEKALRVAPANPDATRWVEFLKGRF